MAVATRAAGKRLWGKQTVDITWGTAPMTLSMTVLRTQSERLLTTVPPRRHSLRRQIAKIVIEVIAVRSGEAALTNRTVAVQSAEEIGWGVERVPKKRSEPLRKLRTERQCEK